MATTATNLSELAELLERFRRGAELMAVTMTGVAGVELDFVPGPGKWSIREILCHVADSEIVGADRFRRIIAEDNPTLIAFNQDAWAANLDYARRKQSLALENFRRIRAENYELLKGVPEAAWQRTGNHSERGTITLLDMLRLWADHAEKHARQIQEARQAYRQSRAK
jgi:hypothetical protein